MSRTNNMRRANIRWQLLATVSAIALTASSYTASQAAAAANDSDRPLFWIELGGQLDALADGQEQFRPSFLNSFSQADMWHTVDLQGMPHYALDADGKLSFQPDGSDWIFSASIRYGRSKVNRNRHQQTKNPYIGPVHFTIHFYGTHYFDGGTKYPDKHKPFANATASQGERHLILDFQAGKDVGLGMFGGGTSVLSAGVRFAQFSSRGHVNLAGVPDLQYPNPGEITSFTAFRTEFKYRSIAFHNYSGMLDYKRSFHGVGPSLAWTGSLPLAGNVTDGELGLDFGANAALLFGRQKVSGNHVTKTLSYHGSHWHWAHARDGQGVSGRNGPFIVSGYFVSTPGVAHTNDVPMTRSHAVTVPNLGGTVGLSYRIADFKVEFGYRADFFFNAIDGGIDTRKQENRAFFGPYASISIGIGD